MAVGGEPGIELGVSGGSLRLLEIDEPETAERGEELLGRSESPPAKVSGSVVHGNYES